MLMQLAYLANLLAPFGLLAPILTNLLPALNLPLDGVQDLLIVPGLLDEVAGAATHRLDCQLHAAPSGHNHERQAVVEGLDAGEQFQALDARGGVARVIQ